jgi:hypothetical protein
LRGGQCLPDVKNLGDNITYLIELKEELRQASKADRRLLYLEIDSVAVGYRWLCAHAPSRKQGYLSDRRSGVTSSGRSSNRVEEHLAVGLFNKKALVLPNGGCLSLLDYQFPLRSAHTDTRIGKVDLLGLFADGTLAVIELKVDSSLEDRRIGLVEGLIYAAIVEGNIEQIAEEVLLARQRQVLRVPPKILVVAPPRFWSDARGYPSTAGLQKMTSDIMSAIPIEIALLCLNDAELIGLGLNGRRPTVRGSAFLSPVSDNHNGSV